MSASEKIQIVRWTEAGRAQESEDAVALEEPLEIRIDDRSISITMRTPGDDEDLAIGFLVTEGLIKSPQDILSTRLHPRNAQGNVINVFLDPKVVVDFAQLTRHVFASSSCGLCGKASIASVHQHFPPISSEVRVKASVIPLLPDRLRQSQKTFQETGGLHAAGLFSLDGDLLVSREDVGRHNAVDKVIGHAFRQGWGPLNDKVLMVSGRASFEILQKALAARIPILCAVSAPSSLAVQFAKDSGQTLVGFLRGNAFNVYAHETRLQG